MHKRVRTDTFESGANSLRVTGRQGFESSTDIWVSRTIEGEFQQARDDVEEVGWNVLRNNTMYGSDHVYDQPNLNGTVTLQLNNGSICDSLENVRIRPVGCKTSYDAFPKTQLKLLPYLVPFRQLVRQDPFRTENKTGKFNVTSESSHVGGVMPDQH